MDSLKELLDIMERLRSPNGCPWDREQTHQSIRSDLLEEAYEVLEALDCMDEELMKEELGDLLLQVVFHSQIAKERGAFEFEDVARGIADKLIRRHPHVFGDEKIETAQGVLKKWDQIKQTEKAGVKKSALDGVVKDLPALAYAQKLQKKAAKVGFDWKESSAVIDKIREELCELEEAIQNGEHIEEEMGDLFFVLVNLCRHLNLDSEQACRLSSKKFKERFVLMEELMKKEGVEMGSAEIEVLENYWQRAKEELSRAVK